MRSRLEYSWGQEVKPNNALSLGCELLSIPEITATLKSTFQRLLSYRERRQTNVPQTREQRLSTTANKGQQSLIKSNVFFKGEQKAITKAGRQVARHSERDSHFKRPHPTEPKPLLVAFSESCHQRRIPRLTAFVASARHALHDKSV